MKKRIARLFRDEAGQGLTEYIIIVALIAIAAVGVVSIFSTNVRSVFAAAANVLAGDENVRNEAEGGKSAAKKTLSNFGELK